MAALVSERLAAHTPTEVPPAPPPRASNGGSGVGGGDGGDASGVYSATQSPDVGRGGRALEMWQEIAEADDEVQFVSCLSAAEWGCLAVLSILTISFF